MPMIMGCTPQMSLMAPQMVLACTELFAMPKLIVINTAMAAAIQRLPSPFLM